MYPFIHFIEQQAFFLAEHVPLELFVLVGAFTEEVFAPIPAMLIMTTAGLLAHIEHHTPFFLIWLVLLGGLGKLLATSLWYVVGDKLEDVVVKRYGRYFGIAHTDIERLGTRLSGGMLDGLLLFLLRALPFMPSATLSVACGVIKVRWHMFLLTSYLGSLCKDFIYILAGYYGVRAFHTLLLEIERVRFGVGIIIVIGILLLLIFMYRKRHHGLRFLNWLKEKLSI